MNTGKLYLYGFLLTLILISGWYIIGELIEKGRLEKANATLNQAVKDGEAEHVKLKAAAALNTTTIAKAEKEKRILNTYALKKAHELEVLKYENAEIKKWSIGVMPFVLAGKLFDLIDNDDKNGLYITADGVINANAGAEIEVRNEAIYNYSNELKTALLSCNVDKAGLADWYTGADVIF